MTRNLLTLSKQHRARMMAKAEVGSEVGLSGRGRGGSWLGTPGARVALLFALTPLVTGATALGDPGGSAPGLGTPVSPTQAATLTPTIYPDGQGLPGGRGSVSQGQRLYATRCAVCHGADGRGGTADALAGGDMPLDSETPDKVIGTYWPYATTLFDFIRRAMPMSAPKSLTDDEVYAVTAYLLYLNDLVDAEAMLDASSLSAIHMPNRDGFIWVDVPPTMR